MLNSLPAFPHLPRRYTLVRLAQCLLLALVPWNAALAKDVPVTGIMVYGEPGKLAYVQVTGFLVNGKTAGHHFGIFLPFAIDITDLIRFGETNDLRIGIRKPSLFDRKGAYGRRPYQAGSFWGRRISSSRLPNCCPVLADWSSG